MPSAVTEGWLISLAAIFVSVLIPLMRWVASRWREARDEAIQRAERAEKTVETLKEEAVKRTEALYEAKVEKMILETRLEQCESDRDNWQSGRWKTK